MIDPSMEIRALQNNSHVSFRCAGNGKPKPFQQSFFLLFWSFLSLFPIIKLFLLRYLFVAFSNLSPLHIYLLCQKCFQQLVLLKNPTLKQRIESSTGLSFNYQVLYILSSYYLQNNCLLALAIWEVMYINGRIT